MIHQTQLITFYTQIIKQIITGYIPRQTSSKLQKSEVMTLCINITDISKKGNVFIEGSVAGVYNISSKAVGAKKQFTCAKTDRLRFILCDAKNNIEPVDILAENTHYFAHIIDKFSRQNPNKNSIEDYEITLYTQKHEPYATISMNIKFEKSLTFMGTLPISPSHSKFQSFFKGTCPSRNFFNCLDGKVLKLPFKFFEPNYRDVNM